VITPNVCVKWGGGALMKMRVMKTAGWLCHGIDLSSVYVHVGQQRGPMNVLARLSPYLQTPPSLLAKVHTHSEASLSSIQAVRTELFVMKAMCETVAHWVVHPGAAEVKHSVKGHCVCRGRQAVALCCGQHAV